MLIFNFSLTFLVSHSINRGMNVFFVTRSNQEFFNKFESSFSGPIAAESFVASTHCSVAVNLVSFKVIITRKLCINKINVSYVRRVQCRRVFILAMSERRKLCRWRCRHRRMSLSARCHWPTLRTKYVNNQ